MNIPLIHGIPQLGLGTYPLTGDTCYNAVRMAIDLGYRHIDTAQMYQNEADVGRAVADCGVARKDLFIVTKVDPSNLRKEAFQKSVEHSVHALQGPADLLLIHWPPPDPEIPAMLDLLMVAQDKGHTHRIGVSNFSPRMLALAQKHCIGRLVNNQVEFHPQLDQHRAMAEATRQNLALSAYSPLARGEALRLEPVQRIAKLHNRPPSEIVLRWIFQQGVIAIPMTTKRDNAASNLRAFEFTLSPTEMAEISGIGTAEGRTVAPSWMQGRWD
jgi:2,5-diketo-D-gluconate reductase B